MNAQHGRDSTIRLTTGDAIIRFLAAQYSERDGVRRPVIAGLLGILGHGNAAGIGYGAMRNRNLRFIQGKNEQAMVHTAIGYARASNLMSTLAVTSSIGPGATNLVTGAATATINRVPVLLLPGDVFSNRRQGPVLQQLEHPISLDVSVNDALRPVSVFFDRVMRPEQAVESLTQAVRALLRPGVAGAVTIAVAQDVQGEAYDFPASMFVEHIHLVGRSSADPLFIRRASEMVVRSTRPLLVSGGGVKHSDAGPALVQLANNREIPVVETHAGRGTAKGAAIHGGGIGFVGSSVGNRLARDADIVIAVGTRLSDTITASRSLFQHPDVAFIGVNASDRDAAKMGGTPLVGDARAVLADLERDLSAHQWKVPSTYASTAREAISAWRTSVSDELEARHGTRLTVTGLVNELNLTTNADDRVVLASSSAISDVHALWDVETGATLDLEYGFSCMGHEIPGAVGERLALGEGNEVYAVVGDGSYLMGNTAELVTAIQEGLRITVIVLVNHGYQCIREFQEHALGVEFATQFKTRTADGYCGDTVVVDYAKNAASFGCAVWDVHDRGDLRVALAEAKATQGPGVIAAHVGLDTFGIGPDAWWDYGAPEPGDDLRVGERSHAHVAQRSNQRWMP